MNADQATPSARCLRTGRLLINCFVAELRVRIVARKDAGGRASPALPATTRTQRAAILAAETHGWIIQQSPSAVNRSLGACVRCSFLQLTEHFHREGARARTSRTRTRPV
jgi:hypothetical protein